MPIPSVELHSHLEGTIHPSLARQLAKRNNLPLPEARFSEDGEGYRHEHFLDFLHAYDLIAELIKHPIDYYDLTLDYLVRNAKKGAIYLETMYSPDHAEKSTGIPSIEHLAAIQQAIQDAEKRTGVIGRIIISGVRHFGAEAVEKVAKEAIRNPLPCVVGFGLGGDEINYPPEWFAKAYAIAHEGGLACNVHAGEFAPAETMITALDTLPVQRIGHGVEAIKNPEVMARLKDKHILLEMCPSSNVSLGLFPSIEQHPLPKFMEAGIQVCLNSDDPPFFNTDLATEYDRVQKAFQFSDQTMLSFTKMGIDAAFVDEATKDKLRQKAGL